VLLLGVLATLFGTTWGVVRWSTTAPVDLLVILAHSRPDPAWTPSNRADGVNGMWDGRLDVGRRPLRRPAAPPDTPEHDDEEAADGGPSEQVTDG
jgi:hypothetical protein